MWPPGNVTYLINHNSNQKQCIHEICALVSIVQISKIMLISINNKNDVKNTKKIDLIF